MTTDLVPGIRKDSYGGYALYTLCSLTDEVKNLIRKYLVSICRGEAFEGNSHIIYSYKSTCQQFLERYEKDNSKKKTRRKGLMGELIVHVILQCEGKTTIVSPFFNMEDSGFRKGYDVVLMPKDHDDIFLITEVKSGEMQKSEKTVSSSMVNLINTALTDLKKRLVEPKAVLWANAINAAKVSMDRNDDRQDAIIELLASCSDKVMKKEAQTVDYDVILAGVLFHSLDELVNQVQIEGKYNRLIAQHVFNNSYIISVQESAYTELYNFLKSESAYE